MVWSNEWENKIYGKSQQLNDYPWSNVITLYKRFYTKDKINKNFLELGCGACNNLGFFLNEGFNCYGIDGSKSAISYAIKKFKNKKISKLNLSVGDFSENIGFKDIKFDIILDRASICHNKYSKIIKIVNDIHKVMKPGGIFLALDWYSIYHTNFKEGEEIDTNTFIKSSGQFKDIGTIFFADYSLLKKIFKKFKIIYCVENKKIDIITNLVTSSYSLVLKK